MASASVNFLRVFIAILGVLFAYQLGKVVTNLKTRGLPFTKASTWFLRVFVILFAVFWVGGFDAVTGAAVAFSVLAFAGGVWQESRRKRDESVRLNLE